MTSANPQSSAALVSRCRHRAATSIHFPGGGQRGIPGPQGIRQFAAETGRRDGNTWLTFAISDAGLKAVTPTNRLRAE